MGGVNILDAEKSANNDNLISGFCDWRTVKIKLGFGRSFESVIKYPYSIPLALRSAQAIANF